MGYESSEDSHLRSRVLEVLSITTLGAFLAGFNARLAVVGLPVIAGDLDADIVQVIWIIQGYMLGSTITQLIIGRLADLFGRVKLFNMGIAIFALGVFLSGLSTNPIFLTIFRFTQGVGAAFLMNLSITILTDNVPSNKLATVLGVNQVAWRGGALLGLTLSGVIIDLLDWRWIFLIQVPMALASLIWSSRRLVESYKPTEEVYIDYLGFTLFTLSMITVLMGLTYLNYGMATAATYALMLFAALLMTFILWELRVEHPALDLSIFKNWMFTGGIIAQLLYAIGFGASLTLLAIYMQCVAFYTPTQTGLLLMPFELFFLVFGVVGGRISDLIGFSPVASVGLASSAAALYMMSNMGVLNDVKALLVAEALLGVGTGLFVSPNTSSIMAAVPAHRRGVASSLRTIAFNIGFIVSLNIAILILTIHLPYSVATRLVLVGGESLSSIDLNSLVAAVGSAFRVQAAIMAAAIPFTLSRMRTTNK